MRALHVGLIALLSCPVSLVGQTRVERASQEDLKNAVHEIEAAEQKGDLAVMKFRLSDDCLLIGPSGKVFHKADALSEAHDNPVTHTDEILKVIGDIGIVTDEVKSGDESYRILTVWRFAENKWQIVANSVVPLDTK
jgi:hypothetical protein